MENIFENKFEKRLFNLTSKLQGFLFYRVIQKTLLMIFPFILIGSFLKIIQTTIINKEGFLSTLLPNFEDSLFFNQFAGTVNNFSNLTLGFAAVFATFEAAKYTAKYYHRDDQLAGLTSLTSLLIISYSYTKTQSISFHAAVLGVRGILFAVILGMFTGWIFKKFTRPIPKKMEKNLATNILKRAFISLPAMLIILFIAIIFSALVNVAYYSHLPEEMVSSLANNYQNKNSFIQLLSIFGFSIYTIIMSFFGWAGPYSPLEVEKSDPNVLDNLYYALNHHTAWGAPYNFTSNTLYHAFATFGGAGSTLSLIIAIFLVSRDPDFQKVARWTMIPGIFNINSGLLTGIPVMFNVTFIIPFLLAPLVSMVIAAIALTLHLMPPCVYPIPVGTPGPLIAFIGTNGSWQALLFSIINIVVSVYIYIPFVKIAEKIKIAEALKEGTEDNV